jgi:hypothetical protein
MSNPLLYLQESMGSLTTTKRVHLEARKAAQSWFKPAGLLQKTNVLSCIST